MDAGVQGVRPLWADLEAARTLFEQRGAIYAQADLIVEAEARPDEVAASIETLLRA